jgi:hypothetical protein
VEAGRGIAGEGEQGLRSAREVLMEMDADINAANILQKCLAGGVE